MNINKKRLLVLSFINLLIIVHITLWYKFGCQKVGTFSLNGVGSHFAFFQECALKIFGKFGINPKIIHSNANIIQYVFLLKTLTAIYEFWLIYGPPQFHIGLGDTHVMTVDLPRSPIIIILFVLFDAFLFIYLMGSRAFCRYLCPWAPLLAIFDNFSFWRIRKVNECKGCMSCTK